MNKETQDKMRARPTIRFHRTSPYTGKSGFMDLPINLDEVRGWQEGELIQNVWPFLTDDEREFIFSGYQPGEFEKAMIYGTLENEIKKSN